MTADDRSGDQASQPRPGYADALRLPGAVAFSSVGFIARMPLSIVGLGIVLYISGTTGSYAIAGAMSAAYALAAAGVPLLTSRLVDRRGQSRVLPVLAPIHAALLVGFVLAVEADAPIPFSLLLAAAAGATQLSIGSLVRARWAHAVDVTGSPMALLRRAFALESILDELIFAIGPLIAATSVTAIALPAPLLIGATLVLVGGLALAAQRSTEPPPHPHAPDRGRALRQRGILAVALTGIGFGAVFGSYEVAAVAFAEQRGQAAATGIVLALWAGGSAAGGLWFGARHWRKPLPTQLAIVSGILAVVLLPAMIVTTVPLLALATVVSGAAVAPSLITYFSTTERIMPRPLLTEGLTIANSALSVGFAAGTGLGGVLVDEFGTTWAFALPVAAALWSCAIAAVRRGPIEDAIQRRAQAHEHDATAAEADDVIDPVTAAIDEPLPGPRPFDRA